MSTQKLIDQVTALPVEDRLLLVDSLLQSLNQLQPEIEKQWAEVAQRRLNELRSGQVKPVHGDKVFDRIWKSFEK